MPKYSGVSKPNRVKQWLKTQIVHCEGSVGDGGRGQAVVHYKQTFNPIGRRERSRNTKSRSTKNK